MASKFSITAELNLQTKNLNQVVNNLKQKFQGADLNIKIKDLDAAQNKVNAISKSARSASQSMGVFGDSVGFAAKKFGAITLATGTFVGLARAIKNSLGEALDFEKEMVKVASAAGKTVGSLKSLEREIGNVSSSFGVSSKELVSATRNLVQAGFAANKVQGALKLLAQTELSGTFDSITDTTEGVIAILNQFGREAQNTGREIEFLERSLSAISKVSKDFAVESGDLITAIRTTGSAFQSAGGDLDELIAIFTSIRSTTRESAESISTGLRTIFTRVQRVDTINTLKQLGIELQDTEGKFIGPLKAAEKLSAALNAIDPKDFRFNVIVEELGGFRQVSKVIPLIQQYGVAVRALDAAQKSSGDLAKDSANAQKSLSNQISKTREEFKTFIRELTNDASFRQSVTYLLDIASAFLKIADSLKPLLPLISAFTAVRIGNALLPALGGLSGFTQKKAMGGPIKFAKGGIVPGTGNGDTVPAMLTPGEFVIRKSSVKKLGAENLAGINKYANGGMIQYYKESGKVISNDKSRQENQAIIEKKPIRGETDFTHLDKLYKGTKKAGKMYSAFGIDLPSRWNNDWRLKPNEVGPTPDELAGYIESHDIFKTLKGKGGSSDIYSWHGKGQQKLVVEMLNRREGSIKNKFAAQVRQFNKKKIFDTDSDVIDARIGEMLIESFPTKQEIENINKQTQNLKNVKNIPTTDYQDLFRQNVKRIIVGTQIRKIKQGTKVKKIEQRRRLTKEEIEKRKKYWASDYKAAEELGRERLYEYQDFIPYEEVNDQELFFGGPIQKFALGGAAVQFRSARPITIPNIDTYTFNKPAGVDLDAKDRTGGGKRSYKVHGQDRLEYNREDKKINVDLIKNKISEDLYDEYINAKKEDIRGKLFEQILLESKLAKEQSRLKTARLDGISASGNPFEAKSTEFALKPKALEEKLWGAIIDNRSNPEKIMRQRMNATTWTDSDKDIFNVGTVEVFQDITGGLGKKKKYKSLQTLQDIDERKNQAEQVIKIQKSGRERAQKIIEENEWGKRGVKGDASKIAISKNTGQISVGLIAKLNTMFDGKKFDEVSNTLSDVQLTNILAEALGIELENKNLGGFIRKFASGGYASGTDTVPAMLTPGEFVVNKKSAQAIGYSNLHRMNKVGKFANGGPVGVQHLAAGDMVAGQTFLKAAGYTGKATGATQVAYEAELLKASKILTELSKSGLSTEGALKKLIDQVTKQGTAFQLSSSQVKSFEKAIEIATNKQNAQKAATTKAIEEENKAIESTSTKLLFLASVVGNSAAEYSSLEQEYKSGVQSAISSLAITKSVFEQVAVSVDDFFSSYSKLSPFVKDFASGMKSGVNAVSFLASAVNGYSAYIQASAEKGMKASEESLKKTKETGVLPDIDKIKSQYKGIGESVRMQQAAMTATNPLYQVLGLSIAGGISVGAGALKRKGYSYGGNVDTIDAKLTAGEYIIRKQAVDHYGTDFLDSINKQKYKYNKGGKVYKFASGGTFGKILKGGAKLIGSGLAMGAVSAAPGAIAGAVNYSSNQNLPAEFEKLGQSLAQSAISLYKFNKILQELETIKSEKITKTQEDLYSNFVSVQERVQYFRSEFEKGNLSVAPILEKAEEEAAQLKEAFRKLGDELNKRTTQDFSKKAAAGFQVSEKDIIDSSKNIATPFNKIIVNLGKKLEAASTPEEAKSIRKQIFETAQERDKSVEADKISKAKTIKQSYELAAQMKREENLRNSLIGTLAQEQAIRNASTKAMFQFESVSSKIARIGGDFANFSSIPTPESLSAGGGTEELSQSLSFVTKVLGSSGAQLSQNFIDLQDSVKIIDTAFLELDKGIGQDINFEKFFEDYFKSQTGRSGGTVTKKIAEFIKETLGGKDQTKGITPGTVGSSEAVKSIRQKIKEYEESLREQLTAIISVFSEFDKSLNQPLQKIVESTQTISELQVQSAESLGKYIDLMAKMYGKDVSLRQKDQLRASRQSILGGKAGGNPAALLKNIRSATDQRNILQESSFKNALSGGVEGIVNFKRQMAGLDSSINNSKKALAELADQSDRTSDIMDQFQKEEEKRKTVQEYGKSFTFAGKEERYNQAKAIEAARTAFMTGDITSIPEEMRKSVEQLLDNFKDIELFGSGMTGEDISKQLQYRELVKSGVAPNAAQSILTRTDPQEKLIRELQNTFASEQAARNALAQVEFDSQAELNTSIQQLSAIALQYLSEIQKGKIEAERQTSGARGALQNQGIAPAPTISPAEFDRMAASLATSIEKFEKTMENILARAENLPPAQKKAKGGIVYRQSGGSIFQPKGTDTVPAMLTPGEFVMPVSAVNKYGTNMLENMRAGKYAKGGLVSYLQYGGRVDYVNQLMQRQMAARQSMMQNQMGSRLAWMIGQSGYSPRRSRRANREANQEQVQSNYEQQVAAQANNGEGLTPNQRVASTVAGGARVVTDVRNQMPYSKRMEMYSKNQQEYEARNQPVISEEGKRSQAQFMAGYYGDEKSIGYGYAGSDLSTEQLQKIASEGRMAGFVRQSYEKQKAEIEANQLKYQERQLQKVKDKSRLDADLLQSQKLVEYNKQLQEYNNKDWFSRQFSSAPVDPRKNTAENFGTLDNFTTFRRGAAPGQGEGDLLDRGLEFTRSAGIGLGNSATGLADLGAMGIDFAARQTGVTGNYAEKFMGGFKDVAFGSGAKNRAGYLTGETIGNLAQMGRGSLTTSGLKTAPLATAKNFGKSLISVEGAGTIGGFAAKAAGYEDVGNIIDVASLAATFRGGRSATQGADIADTPSSTTKFAEFLEKRNQNKNDKLAERLDSFIAKKMGQSSSDATRSLATEALANKKLYSSNPDLYYKNISQGIKRTAGGTLIPPKTDVNLKGRDPFSVLISSPEMNYKYDLLEGQKISPNFKNITDNTKIVPSISKYNKEAQLELLSNQSLGGSNIPSAYNYTPQKVKNKNLDLVRFDKNVISKQNREQLLKQRNVSREKIGDIRDRDYIQNRSLEIQRSAPPVPQRTEHSFAAATRVNPATKLKAQAQGILKQHTQYGLPKEIEKQLLSNLNFKSENFKDLGEYNRRLKSIRINEKIINDPKQVSPVLSHELGHAILNTNDPSIFERFSNFYNQNSKKFEDVFTELQGKGKYVPYGKNINTALEKYKHIKASPEALMRNAQEEMFTQLMQHSKDPNANSLLRETFKAMFEPTGFAKGGPVGYYKTGGVVAPTVATEGQRRAAARERADNVGVMQRKYESAQMGHNLFNNAMQNPFNQFNGMSMNHALNVDGQLNIGGINGEAIASQIKEGLGKYVAQIVMNMMKNQGIKNTNPNGI